MCHKCKLWLNNAGDVCLSPLLLYLNDAEHENVALRNDVHVGKTAIECSRCGCSNELVVSFASVESNSVAVVLSRQMNEPCNRRWKEMTDDVLFSSFMVKVPGATSKKLQSENRVCVLHTSNNLISSGSHDSEVKPQPIPSSFNNGAEYLTFFSPLINLESDYLKYLAQTMHQRVNIKVHWTDSPNGKVCANFIMEYDDAVWKLRLGEKLKLRLVGNDTNWSGVGRIVKLPQNYNEEISLEMEKSKDIPREPEAGFSVSHVWMSTSYDRKVLALEKFANWNNQNPLYEQILGTYVENAVFEWSNSKLYSDPSLPPLSAHQENIVKKAIRHHLTLIQGPTATGKTVTLLSILYNLVHLNKGPILVCAPTNSVVDYLALCIHRMKLEVVRLFAETRPSDGSRTHFLSLDRKSRRLVPTEYEVLLSSYDKGEELSLKDIKKLREWRKRAERDILDSAEVICCTCIAAGDARLSSMKFHAILIDESMQATEPECLIPIALGCERLVLVGDQFQLAPIIKCKEALKAGLDRSLFKRLVSIGVQPLNLIAQYRMHPKLWHFPSTHYVPNSSLHSGVSAAQRKLPDQVLPWPVPDFPFMFYDVRSFEVRSWPVISYTNRAEASAVTQIVTRLLKRGISPDRIGIATQYEGQKKYLSIHMEELEGLHAADRDTYRKIEVNKVEAFQGREKDIIILSCVRSQGTTGVGSLNYFRYFHLALTRAKFGLVIVGNAVAVSKEPMWRDLLDFCQQQGLLVEGKLDDLKKSKARLSVTKS